MVEGVAGQWGSAKGEWEGWTRRSWSTPWSTWPPTSSPGSKGDWAVLGKDRQACWGLHLGTSNLVDIQTKQATAWELGVLAMVDKARFGLVKAKRRRDGQVQLGPGE